MLRWCLLVVVLQAGLTSISAGVKKPSQLPPANLNDIKYIKCAVCKLLAKNAHSKIKRMKKELKPGKKLAEMDIIETLEKMMDPLRNDGHWISRLDMVEKEDKIVLKDMGHVGECGRECKTIAKAAEQILGEHDTDLAEILLKGKKNRAKLTNWLCFEISNACRGKAPPLPKDREPGPPFKPLAKDEAYVTNMMGEMRAKGMRGKLVKPDEVLERGGRMDEDADYDDDDMFGMANGGFPGMGSMGGGGFPGMGGMGEGGFPGMGGMGGGGMPNMAGFPGMQGMDMPDPNMADDWPGVADGKDEL